MIRLKFLLALLVNTFPTQAQSDRTLTTSFFVDTTAQLPYEVISSERFAADFNAGPVVTSRNYPVWIKIEIPDDLPHGQYCINFNTSAAKELFYIRQGKLVHTRNGQTVPYSHRSFNNPNYLCFSVDDPTPAFFVKLGTVMSPYSLPALLLEPEKDTAGRYARELAYSYLATGAVLVFFLCCITLYLSLRDKSFLVYSLFLVCFYAMTNKEFLGYLMGGTFPKLFFDPHINQLFFIANPFSFLLFVTFYFKILEAKYKWRRLFVGAMLFSLLCLVAVFLTDQSTSSLLILFYNLAAVVLAAVYAASRYFIHRNKRVVYFVIGMAFLLAAALLIALKSFGLVAITRLDLLADYTILVLSVILLLGVIQDYRDANRQKLLKELEAEKLKYQTTELTAYNALILRQKLENQRQAFELEEMNVTKDKLLSVLAHDLRGPVANLNAILELVSNKHLSADEFYKLSGKLKTDVGAAFTMLEEVLQWVKSQRDGIVPKPVTFRMDDVLQNIANSFRSVAEAKRIHIHLPNPDGVQVLADRDHTAIVIRNILGNAIKFSPESSHINITRTKLPTRLEVSITDAGPGLTPENITRILRKEKISGAVGSKGEKGTGLGLFLTMEFLQYNEGDFKIESTPGKGTTVSFSLPLTVEPATK